MVGLVAALLVSTSLVFHFAGVFLGKYAGYLVGFAFYWLFWCHFVPRRVLGKPVRELFVDREKLFVAKNWWIIGLFASTLVAPFFMYFIPELGKTPVLLFILAVPLALANGYFEETLWRGLFVRVFPDSMFWGMVAPTVFFSLWHIAPQLALPADYPLLFVLSTLPLGMTYAIVAYTTKSARWSAIGHGLSGVFAFSGYLSTSVYALLFGIVS
jgi:hypothetical protein